MANVSHVSVSKVFASGDATEWFKRFDICSAAANGWNDAVKAAKLPTLLDGEALAVWLELDEDVQKDYKRAKQKIVDVLMPTEFVTLDKFHNRRLLPGEALSVFVHDLKKLLSHAMPGIEANAKDQLLLHQLMAGLPTSITKQLRASGEIKNFNDTVQRARLLLSIEEQHSVVAVGSSGQGVQELEQRLGAQIEALSEQVAALARPTGVKKCFYCKEQDICNGIAQNADNQSNESVTVKDLVSPCILGVDFLHAQKLMLDFGQCPVRVCRQGSVPQRSVQSVPDSACTAAVNLNNKQGMDYDGGHVLQGEKDQEECAVPCFRNTDKIDFPTCPDGSFVDLLQSFKDLFKSTPGKTTLTHHLIPTTGSPLKVPPRRVPAEYRAEVEGLLKEMLQEGIIEESSSPWMAPAVYVKKKTGEIRLCVDYRALNKQTTKDAYPLPLPDEVQDRLYAGVRYFPHLILGPGLGLFHFKRMPFGLTGAPGSFQRLMDKVLHGLNFVTTYLDDVLVHSKSKDEHIKHLNVVFSRLKNGGLTLRGSKCHIGHDKVYYLGHVFSEQGMRPDEGKVRVVKEWPTPKNPSEVRQFLGLASYYRRYIQSFATIAASLHELTQKDVSFRWTSECDHAFNLLKEKLTQAPILVYPQFGSEATPFILETDAKKNYSVIQKECLAIVYGTKQFRHYLLGRSFTVLTDHAPLQWLSAQKMEGLLCRWALALQEYDFVVQYRKGSQNSNADALSRLPSCTVSATTAVVGVWEDRAALRLAQEQDSVLRKVIKALKTSRSKPSSWSEQPLRRYAQLWQQLVVTAVDGIACRSNRYLLVVQDYFTKWAEAIPMVDQTAATITNALVKLCSVFGLPEVIHSDQGRAFESMLMKNMLDTFCINKSRTTAYHPQCDGMVERFNRSLLQLLRAYVEKESDWERYLSMALFAYRTAVHSSTGVSPFMLMFGRPPRIPPVIDKAIAFDTGTYFHQLRVKFSELQDFVHEKLKNEAFHQQEAYDKTYKARGRKFKIGEAVWLSIPTAGKLQSRWEGMWIVKAIKSEVNLEISDGVRTKVVHVNRIRHRLQPQPGDDASPADDSKGHNSWVPPQIDHFIDEIGVPDNPSQERRYPQRTRNLPERYGPYLCHACGQA
eukprot:Em0017g7a